MAKTMSMTSNQNHDDAFTRKKIKTCDEVGLAPWSDLNHDVLFLVMMRLGFVDFPAFSRVCKSWRSLALTNKKTFITSRPPMSVSFSTDANEKDCCYLEDIEGRKFKTIIPYSAGRMCVGVTCGYLVLFGKGKETNDYWLVNPITRHQLHFPNSPSLDTGFKGILVFSRSMSGWLLAITRRFDDVIWFSIAGKGVWSHVFTGSHILDLHAFKGKIYKLNVGYLISDMQYLCEITLGPDPKSMLLKTNNLPTTTRLLKFVRSSENLHVLEYISEDLYRVHQLDIGDMVWVYHENTKEEYAFYRNHMDHITAVKRVFLAGTDKSQKDRFRFDTAYMWYFPHECLNEDLIDE